MHHAGWVGTTPAIRYAFDVREHRRLQLKLPKHSPHVAFTSPPATTNVSVRTVANISLITSDSTQDARRGGGHRGPARILAQQPT